MARICAARGIRWDVAELITNYKPVLLPTEYAAEHTDCTKNREIALVTMYGRKKITSPHETRHHRKTVKICQPNMRAEMLVSAGKMLAGECRERHRQH
jgi:hypothetical protein